MAELDISGGARYYRDCSGRYRAAWFNNVVSGGSMKKISAMIAVALVMWSAGFSHSATSGPQALIDELEIQIEAAATAKEKAELRCFQARHYQKLGDTEKAEEAYLAALRNDCSGWILNEYGYFLYETGNYEKALEVANSVLNEYPYLKDAEKLWDQAYEKYHEAYVEENPPVIVIDTYVDPSRVTRHDLIREIRAQNPSPSSAPQRVSSATKTTTRSSTTSSSSRGGGRDPAPRAPTPRKSGGG
jgi:tetratricopeptide (TPR) repeat protein